MRGREPPPPFGSDVVPCPSRALLPHPKLGRTCLEVVLSLAVLGDGDGQSVRNDDQAFLVGHGDDADTRAREFGSRVGVVCGLEEGAGSSAAGPTRVLSGGKRSDTYDKGEKPGWEKERKMGV